MLTVKMLFNRFAFVSGRLFSKVFKMAEKYTTWFYRLLAKTAILKLDIAFGPNFHVGASLIINEN